MGSFKDMQLFTDESMDCDGLIVILECRDINGEKMPVPSFKHILESRLIVQYHTASIDDRFCFFNCVVFV